MSAATDYLDAWISKAHLRAPSVTRVTSQRWPAAGTPPNWKPGIASYGWGINGQVLRDSSGTAIGLVIETTVWFSDRGQDLSHAPPDIGQQFISSDSDTELLYLTLAGDDVLLRAVLVRWNSEYTVATSTLDTPSQQLLFSVPGAGPNAPPALLALSFADTGEFGWV